MANIFGIGSKKIHKPGDIVKHIKETLLIYEKTTNSKNIEKVFKNISIFYYYLFNIIASRRYI